MRRRLVMAAAPLPRTTRIVDARASVKLGRRLPVLRHSSLVTQTTPFHPRIGAGVRPPLGHTTSTFFTCTHCESYDQAYELGSNVRRS
jgi:hypothetical protein